VDALLDRSFASRRFFVSSNTGDFATAKITRIHPDIQPSFDPPREIHYFVNLSTAVASLKTGGWVP